jgi:hypothetical protein
MNESTLSAEAINGDGTEVVIKKGDTYNKLTLTYGCDDPHAYNYAAGADITECCKYSDDATVTPFNTDRTRVPIILTPLDFARAAMNANTLKDKAATAPEGAAWCDQWQKDVLADLSCALRVPANRLSLADASTCANGEGELTVTVDFLPATGDGDTPTQLANKLLSQVKETGSPIWKGYATRYLKHDMAWNGLGATTANVPAPPPSPPPSPMAPAPEGMTVKTVHYAEVTLTAAGNVADYDDAKKTSIATAFATKAGVKATDVEVTVTAASVNIAVKVGMGTGAAGQSAASTLVSDLKSGVLADGAAATSFLAAASVTVQAVEVKAVSKVEYVTPSSSGLGGGAIAVIIIGVALIGILGYMILKKKLSGPDAKGATEFTSRA